MEDALVHLRSSLYISSGRSLNPCFNGRCTRTYAKEIQCTKALKVLILVLMEDALVRTLKAHSWTTWTS